MKSNVAVDLDGILFNFMEALNRVYPEIPKDPERYFFFKKTKKLMDILNTPSFYLKMKTYPGAKALVTFLSKIFNKIYVITSRPLSVKKVTEKSMRGLGLEPRNLIMTRHKEEIIPYLGVTIFFEDNPSTINKCKRLVTVFAPYCSYTKREGFEKEGNIILYRSFKEAKDYIKELF